MSASVSIIIPNWNGAAYIQECLESLRRQTRQPDEIIVVDNASTDGSQQLVTNSYRDAALIVLPCNRGFTGACNTGIRAATGEIIILLNNDTAADPGWVGEVLTAFERHPEAGLVASKMLLYDRRDTLHTSGDLYRLDGTPGNRGVWQKDAERYNTEEYVFSACGGSSAYRRIMLDEIGLLDDDFFFSCEDIDLAWRAQLAGWKCVYAPRAVVYHRLAATGGGPTASFFDGRNSLWVIAKNYPGVLLRKHWPKIFRAQLGLAWSAIQAWRGAAARARLTGMMAGLVTLPSALAKRRTIQRSIRVSADYIESILSPPEAA